MSQSRLSPSHRLEVVERDQAGHLVATYVADSQSSSRKSDDIYVAIPSASRSWSKWLMNAFLPAGYPHSVTSDYMKYQIYDSLQAFSSSIAGLISSRAVLEGVGVGDASASPTSALLLGILQDSMGRMATILFAHRLGTSLEPECKMYRLAADIFNDAAMILDCLSPVFPKVARVALFSTSSILRSLCGVAAGSAKASLSAHFATQGNLGELNAKDSSQETIISLLGMLAGSFVVSRVSSSLASWIMLLFLLTMHLGTNYLAVRAVIMNTLNRQRANIVFSNFLISHEHTSALSVEKSKLAKGGQVLAPEAVSLQEYVFERDGVLRWQGNIIGYAQLGCPLSSILKQLSKSDSKIGTYKDATVSLASILSLFSQEEYILWLSTQSRSCFITLKSTATADTHLKAWLHALLCATSLASANKDEYQDQDDNSNKRALQIIGATLPYVNEVWPILKKGLQEKGWDLTSGAMETRSGTRIVIERQKFE